MNERWISMPVKDRCESALLSETGKGRSVLLKDRVPLGAKVQCISARSAAFS